VPARKTAAKKTAKRTPRAAPRARTPFDRKLVLQAWLLRLLEAKDFETLCPPLFRHPNMEGTDTQGVSHYHRELINCVVERVALPHGLLLEYDQNIQRHTARINRRRREPIRWKYFQYLALLFTEIYLDRWFTDKDGMLAALNVFLTDFNTDLGPEEKLPAYTLEDLRKVALWQATGSGKTLLMHVNLLQFLHYQERAGKRSALNKLLLITPSVGMTRQHLEEFAASGIDAEVFDKDSSGQMNMFTGQSVEVLEISKLGAETKDTVVAVDSFTGSNFVMVDEGHRGARSDEKVFLQRRNALCSEGFAFEYSATFGQAMKAADDAELEAQYARCILFDYSYKFFHGDGYGKDYRILNLRAAKDADEEQRYLTASLLRFYQQLRVWLDQKTEFVEFNVERPLWVFFGAKVNAGEISDIEKVLLFLARFLSKPAESAATLDDLLHERALLLDAAGNNVFTGAFPYAGSKLQLSGQQAYEDILKEVFNAPSGGKLHVRLLKQAPGEVSLSVGVGQAFGVINVGEPGKLRDRCEAHKKEMIAGDQDVGTSLFNEVAKAESRIHLVMGAKKFTEGWSSWRVSSIGLMNMGRTEGSEVIQLFGRGVRLKGWNMTLKRSEALQNLGVLAAPRFLELVETLDVFGVRADYMDAFREYLETEGVKTTREVEEVELSVIPTLKDWKKHKLKIIRVPKGISFVKNGPWPELRLREADFQRYPVKLDWYPRVQAMGRGAPWAQDTTRWTARKLEGQHLAFLNVERLFLKLEELKAARGWHNLAISRETVAELLANPNWYELFIPASRLAFQNMESVRHWQQIVEALMAAYVERFYKLEQQAWEHEHAQVEELDEDDTSLFITQYKVQVEKSQKALLDALKDLKTELKGKKAKEITLGQFRSWTWDAHLYQPLIHLKSGSLIQVQPVALQDSEMEFVDDLKKHCLSPGSLPAGTEIFLLRNQSKKGVGFFASGGFYPDFIVWLIRGKEQHVVFVDPHGLRHSEGMNDPKIRFHVEIKKLEGRLSKAVPGLHLHSFIVCPSAWQTLLNFQSHASQEEVRNCNVIFQVDEKSSYIGQMIGKVLG